MFAACVFISLQLTVCIEQSASCAPPFTNQYLEPPLTQTLISTDPLVLKALNGHFPKRLDVNIYCNDVWLT